MTKHVWSQSAKVVLLAAAFFLKNLTLRVDHVRKPHNFDLLSKNLYPLIIEVTFPIDT